jgi:hypothetical protein
MSFEFDRHCGKYLAHLLLMAFGAYGDRLIVE